VKTLEDQMSFYAAYHQDARNKATHSLGVPMIMASLFIPLAWLRLELGEFAVTGTMVFAAIVLCLLGHAFEGRKPAPTDNFFQIFIAPIFLCAEAFFALGYKAKLHAAVQARALKMRTGQQQKN
jgi:uncharacterized membrane protein YGL010W